MSQSNQYLVFSNETDCKNALNKIWCNYLLAYASDTEKLVCDQQEVAYYLNQIQSYTEAQLVTMSALGKIKGIIQKHSGKTLAYAKLESSYSDPSEFFFLKPNDSLMTGVVNYVIEPFNPEWYPPIES